MQKKPAALTIILLVLFSVPGMVVERTQQHLPVIAGKKNCIGYTIIEFGRGINCNGDTVVLQKSYGFQVLAEEQSKFSTMLSSADEK